MQQELDIVQLIENNPITKLSKDYNVKLLIRIKENFNAFEQQLFLASFYCYLNYHPTKDFVIDLDDIWKWLGFQQKYHAKTSLNKYFVNNIDYKNLDHAIAGARSEDEKWGGHNLKKIFLTINCFKLFCLKADTKKANEIHNYYIKLEQVLQETIEEESNDLKMQLLQNECYISEIKQTAEEEKKQLKKEKQKAVEQEIISLFPCNTECIYLGTIDNTNEKGEKLIKFGHTNHLSHRATDHRLTYNNFCLIKAFRVQNKVEIENLIKTDSKIKKHIRNIEIEGKNKTELIAYDTTNFTIPRLTKYIQDIIHSKTYSIDNFNRLMKENEEYTNEINQLKDQIKKMEELNNQQGVELNEWKEKYENQVKMVTIVQEEHEHESVYKNALIPENELTASFNEFIDEMCVVRLDLEEFSVNIEGRFRLWNKNKSKPTKETFHALKHYLDVRFKAKKLDGGSHGYVGIKLKNAEYKKRHKDLDAEIFIFQECKLSDSGKISCSVLLEEYHKWKKTVNKKPCESDMKDLKDYLNASPFALKAPIWTQENGSCEGFYGVSLKTEIYKTKIGTTTGKKIEKRLVDSNIVVKSWNSIAEAATDENICKSKMSRNVKNKTVYDDYYYCPTG